MGIRHGGWRPDRLREVREARGLTVGGTGKLLREVACDAGLLVPETSGRVLRQHERGELYPDPPYRRVYCLLYRETEPGLGFRHALPDESPALPRSARPALGATLATLVRDGSDPGGQAVCERIGAAWSTRDRATAPSGQPTLLLVCGYAGSGKSEFSRFVSRMTGWPVLDKDRLTQPLVERLLVALGSEADDRHSDVYREQVRPLEYECLLNAADISMRAGASAVLSAPFISEVSDGPWLKGLSERCGRHGVHLSVAWVHSDLDTMHEYIAFRAAARDRWKLDHWDTYAAGLDLQLWPAVPHLVVDNRGGSAVAMTDQMVRAFVSDA